MEDINRKENFILVGALAQLAYNFEIEDEKLMTKEQEEKLNKISESYEDIFDNRNEFIRHVINLFKKYVDRF